MTPPATNTAMNSVPTTYSGRFGNVGRLELDSSRDDFGIRAQRYHDAALRAVLRHGVFQRLTIGVHLALNDFQLRSQPLSRQRSSRRLS